MKRKDFSNLKIEVQKKKNSYFEHENFIAGTPPFLRGINSYSKNKSELTLNKSISSIKLDISNSNLDIKVNELLEVDSILLSNNKEQTSENQIAELLLHTYNLFLKCVKEDILIDEIAPKISFYWTACKDFPFEIAKIRATRMLWAKMVNQFQPKNQKSLALNIYIENIDSISSMIAKTTEAKSCSKDILNENFNSKTIDPWAGSSIIEKLTEDFSTNSWQKFLNLFKKR